MRSFFQFLDLVKQVLKQTVQLFLHLFSGKWYYTGPAMLDEPQTNADRWRWALLKIRAFFSVYLWNALLVHIGLFLLCIYYHFDIFILQYNAGVPLTAISFSIFNTDFIWNPINGLLQLLEDVVLLYVIFVPLKFLDIHHSLFWKIYPEKSYTFLWSECFLIIFLGLISVHITPNIWRFPDMWFMFLIVFIIIVKRYLKQKKLFVRRRP